MANTDARVVISAEDKATRVLQGIRGSVDGAVATFAKLGAAGAALGAGAVLAGVTRLVGALDDLADTAQGLGIAADQLSAFQLAARAGGVEAEQFNGALARLNTKLAEAADEGSDAAELFRRLGVATKNADGSLRNGAEALADIADRFQEYKDGAREGALAAEIFGQRVGPKLVAALNEGREGLTKFGGASAASIEQAGKLQGQIDKLAASWENLRLQITGAVATLINDFTGANLSLERQLEITEKQITDTLEALEGRGPGRIRTSLERSLDEAIKKADQLRAAIKRAQEGDQRPEPPSAPTKAEREAAEASRKRLLELDKLLADAIKIQNEDLQKQLELEAKRQLLAVERFEQAEREADQAARKRAQRLDDLTGRSAAAQQAEDLRLLEEALFDGAISLGEFDAAYSKLFGLDGAATKGIKDTKDAADALALTFASSLGSFIENGGSVRDFFDSLLQDLLKLTTQLLIVKPLAEALKAAFSGGGGVGDSISSLFAGFFADGGFIPPGRFGVVGERGPELAFGGRSGQTIQPMGGPTININLPPGSNVTRQTANQIAGAVSRQLAIANRRNG
jgi:hypothetical protein